jgi:RNA polymerase sigma-70 factor (ECF subfamily)
MTNESRVLYEWIALRCQAQEPGAFEDLIVAMERPLLYYAIALTGSQDRALDVLQDAWLRVFRSIGKLKEPGALKPWLYSVVHGIAVDRIRRSASREQAEAAHVVDFQEAEEPLFAEEDAGAIHEALSQIGLRHREVLVLHFLEDLPVAEIAAIVGCSEGTVKSRLHYAKKAMKQILQGVNHGTQRRDSA